MHSPEERFSVSLDLCDRLLNAEKDAIGKQDAESIETILTSKDEAFAQLLESGEDLKMSPAESPEFASRIEALFSAQQENLELMNETLSNQKKEGVEVREGKARLRMVKGAYLPSSFGNGSLN